MSKSQMQYNSRIIGFFAVLAVSIVAWWVWILNSDGALHLFFENDFAVDSYRVFLFADLLIVATGSALVCWFAFLRLPNAVTATIWFVAGGLVYATVCTISLWLAGDCTLIAVATMVTAAAMCLLVAFTFKKDHPMSESGDRPFPG